MKLFAAPVLAIALLGACAGLQAPQETAHTYVLDARPERAAPGPRRDLVIALSAPRASPGFDTAQMAYEHRPHGIEYYARNRWADAPARMLAPLIASALEHSGSVRGVVPATGAASADLRLDVELLRLVQDFASRPSRVRFTLRAQLVDAATRQVLATREFDEHEEAPHDDAYGGVLAANRALERLLARIVEFCVYPPASR